MSVVRDKRIGALVVGQSPRPEVSAELAAALGPDVSIDLRGALDGFSRAELDGMAPLSAADTLFTRLPDGSGVKLSKAAVVRHGERQLDALAHPGGAVIVLCTGDFPTWEARGRALFPARLLRAAVAGVLPRGRLGVLVPAAEQIDALAPRWREAGYEVVAHALSPNAEETEATAVGEAFRGAAPDLLVFDCISYLRTTKRAVCEAAGVPGLLAIGVCARMAAELAD